MTGGEGKIALLAVQDLNDSFFPRPISNSLCVVRFSLQTHSVVKSYLVSAVDSFCSGGQVIIHRNNGFPLCPAKLRWSIPDSKISKQRDKSLGEKPSLGSKQFANSNSSVISSPAVEAWQHPRQRPSLSSTTPSNSAYNTNYMHWTYSF